MAPQTFTSLVFVPGDSTAFDTSSPGRRSNTAARKYFHCSILLADLTIITDPNLLFSGKYDFEFMDYTVAVLRKVKQYGFKVFMDPHQDVFSRYTGGSGAPYWTIVACGINPRNITTTQAAFLHCEWPNPSEPDPEQFPDMLWATNYTRLAAATLSILFFAGKHFAPKCVIDGKNIQDWLQDHFIAACAQLARRIQQAGDLADDCVIGWDSINEPNKTYLSLQDITKIPAEWQLRKGPVPSPFQSMKLGVGLPQQVENWIFTGLGPKRSGSVTVDPKGQSIWLSHEQDKTLGGSKWGWERSPSWPLGQCVWAAHGVWDQADERILNPSYFRYYHGPGPDNDRPVDFVEDYWLPHWRKYASAIREIQPEAIMFIQPPVFEPPPKSLGHDDLKQRACVSCHFYDGLTLITKHWNWFNADAVGMLRGKYSSILFAIRVGDKAIRKCMREQLGYLRNDTTSVLGQYPTIIGEIGIPYDLDQKRSYYGDSKGHGIGDYSAQTLAMDASLNACDGINVLNYSIWTYCPDNSHQWGDGWDGEDLSIWSEDDMTSPPSQASLSAMPFLGASSTPSSSAPTTNFSSGASSGASSLMVKTTDTSEDLTRPDWQTLRDGTRAAAAFCRPYPVATVGSPVEIDFNIKSSEFSLTIEVAAEDLNDSSLATEIYLPYLHYAAETQDDGDEGLLPSEIRSKSSSSGSESAGLAIDVQISTGYFETRGQYLHWYLHESDSNVNVARSIDSSKARHTIKVKRRGGPIRSIASQATGTGLLGLCNIL